MQLRRFRRVLEGIVAIGLPLASGCSFFAGSDSDEDEGNGDETTDEVISDSYEDDVEDRIRCGESVAVRLTLTSPEEPRIQFLIDQCRRDDSTCQELCNAAFERAGHPRTPLNCMATFDGNQTSVTVRYSNETCDAGRRPSGLAPSVASATSAEGAWLAQAAWLEAASVHAFLRLAHELQVHGAPEALRRAALRSAEDEVQHTRIMTMLAARYGAVTPPVQVAPPTVRRLEAIALENAIEGCVRETWGAVTALWQARRAVDPYVRVALAMIANDEARHAALAWQVDAWLRTRLDAETVSRVAMARVVAARALLSEPVVGNTSLGLPFAHDVALLARRTHAAMVG